MRTPTKVDLNRLIPPVGLPVQFFPRGDLREPPIAGVIVGPGAGGRAYITLFEPGGGEPAAVREASRHASDPWVKENPEQMARSLTYRRGTWDFVPGMAVDVEAMYAVPPKAGSAASAPEQGDGGQAESKLTPEVEQQIREFLANGMEIEKVAQKFRRVGATNEYVQKIAESVFDLTNV